MNGDARPPDSGMHSHSGQDGVPQQNARLISAEKTTGRATHLSMPADLILYALNVHTGGGLVLLKALLNAWPVARPLQAFLDARSRGLLILPANVRVTWVEPRLVARVYAEFQLRLAAGKNSTIFCFHGLPPLLRMPGQVVVLIQNRLLIEHRRVADYPLRVRMRLRIERLWSRALQSRCSRYIVQTPSMANLMQHWLQSKVPVSVAPFLPTEVPVTASSVDSGGMRFDFIYVASGEAHKNHRTLLLAWRLLSDAGLKPSLALTVDPAVSPLLADEIQRVTGDCSLNVVNLGQMPAPDLAQIYRSSSALIYPSYTESLGLPLLEAKRHGLPIVASELDYVRDIVVPADTFDPDSPVSIARAVRRFLDASEPVIRPCSPEEFLSEVGR